MLRGGCGGVVAKNYDTTVFVGRKTKTFFSCAKERRKKKRMRWEKKKTKRCGGGRRMGWPSLCARKVLLKDKREKDTKTRLLYVVYARVHIVSLRGVEGCCWICKLVVGTNITYHGVKDFLFCLFVVHIVIICGTTYQRTCWSHGGWCGVHERVRCGTQIAIQ